LVHLLKKTGKNQPEIANELPYSVSTINRWWNGKTKHIDQSKRETIANKMGFNLQWIEEGGSLDSAQSSVNQVEETLGEYKARGIRQDDPEKLLELAETLIRTARAALNKQSLHDD